MVGPPSLPGAKFLRVLSLTAAREEKAYHTFSGNPAAVV